MNGELIAGRTTTAKRGNSTSYRSDYEMEYDRYPADHYNRVFDCQRVPSSSPVKRRRPSSSSSSSSSSAALRMKSTRASSSSHRKLKMAELLSIKRELTVIKVQIDGLLDCVDKMDPRRKDCSGSVSSLERESPEPGEASEEETLHYCPPRIKQFESDLQDDL
ncbi:RNA-binding Raly-like protein [Gymnodraco acuticeps]|uniref:RNA-binding Raly-like protein n=1 Tax=Gymnodraco acuticeps TaxID=8218 RepID=A0A6P8VX76_GYMAC|nr:RNA-binding Raly-like protein [Gymnodraco acuticeps]